MAQEQTLHQVPKWRVKASLTAQRSNNPIRQIVDKIKKPNLPDKPLIPLSLGDPTLFGNFGAPDVLVMTMHRLLAGGKNNGYIHSAGTIEARRAIAKRSSVTGFALDADDVVIASGCSGALDLAISVLLNPGDVLLLPKPAFALYQTLCESRGIAVDYYRLDPEKGWEADLDHLSSLLNQHGSRVGAILVNNPSNPCGSVYSEAHLRSILGVAESHCVPIIADEIYGGLVFPSSSSPFYPLASLTSTVPILSAGGIAKEFLVPGWRVGWVVVHDRQGLLKEVRKGLVALTQLILGANSLVVSAVPYILDPAAGSPEAASLSAFKVNTIAQLEDNALYCAARLRCIPGLKVVLPQGAMYVMFGLDAAFFAQPACDAAGGSATTCIRDDVELTQALLAEENVFVLPGQCFNMPGFCRIVFCAPKARLTEAFDRLESFMVRHAADPTAAAGTLAANKAAVSTQLAALTAPFVPRTPIVSLSWGAQPSGALTPHLTFLAVPASEASADPTPSKGDVDYVTVAAAAADAADESPQSRKSSSGSASNGTSEPCDASSVVTRGSAGTSSCDGGHVQPHTLAAQGLALGATGADVLQAGAAALDAEAA